MGFRVGSIGGGFFGDKDVLDFIGSLSTLDVVGEGLAATTLVQSRSCRFSCLRGRPPMRSRRWSQTDATTLLT